MNNCEESAAIEYIDEVVGELLLNVASLKYLKMGSKEFLDRYDRGEFRSCDSPEVNRVAMRIPRVR